MNLAYSFSVTITMMLSESEQSTGNKFSFMNTNMIPVPNVCLMFRGLSVDC
jgi:hypothetical protein